jgi:peptidoglycan glycosyltransferase
MHDESMRERDQDLQFRLARINRLLLLLFLVVGLALVFWSVIRAPALLAREDNPRLVEAELRIQRGQILDRVGEPLAETMGPSDQPVRTYRDSGTGPAVGYYSFRHGTSGLEESFDSLLRGDSPDFWARFRRQSLHRPQEGRDVQSTLDFALQQLADETMAGRRGAILLLSVPDAEILAMVSHPGYDPNKLDSEFDALTADSDAPLLNRATQGLYQPGMVLQPFLLASGVDQQLLQLEDKVENASESVTVNGAELSCASTPPVAPSWYDVIRFRCTVPMADLGAKLGSGSLDAIFADFGFTTAPSLAITTVTADSEPVNEPRFAAIGQEELTVTPLQVALAWVALGLDGRIPVPRLVLATQDEAGEWHSDGDGGGFSGTAVSPGTARLLREALPERDSVIEHSALVLSGADESRNGWFLGLAPAESPQFAIVVIVEESQSASEAEAIGHSLLRAAVEE